MGGWLVKWTHARVSAAPLGPTWDTVAGRQAGSGPELERGLRVPSQLGAGLYAVSRPLGFAEADLKLPFLFARPH